MKDFITEFGNFFNKSGTMNTIVWFSVLMLACIICALCRRKELAGVIVAGSVCMFISFSPLSLGIQAIIFVCTARRPGAENAADNTEETEEETQKNG